MDWILEKSVEKDEYESGWLQCESCMNGECMGSKCLAIFKQLILEGNWLSPFRYYPWSWGVKGVVEVRGAK